MGETRKQNWAKQNWALLLAAALTAVGLCYVLVRGQNIYVQVGDNLDSNIPWFTMLRDNHLFFAHDAALPFLGGIDRNYLPSEWNFYSLLFWLLPAFPAYIVGNLVKIVLSVCGWVALGRLAFGAEEPRYRNLMVLGGFIYANLPTFPTLAFSFGALPLGLALLWNIYRAPRPVYYLLLVAWVATTDFSTIGIFCCGFLLLFFIINWVYCRRPAWRMLVALGVLCAAFVLLENRLFAVMLFDTTPTLRQEMATNITALRNVPAHAWQNFWVGDSMAGTLQQYLVAPVCCLYFVWQNLGFVRRRAWRSVLVDPFNLLLYWAAFSAVLAAVQNTVYFQGLLALLPPLAGFNFARGLWINPLLFYLAFFMVLVRLARRGLAGLSYLLAAAGFVVLLVCPGTYNDIQRNLDAAVQTLQGERVETLTWREFYAEDLLDEIKRDIDYDGQWTAAFGMHPGILQQSGFATLDGYLSYYPLAYKQQFRRLIEPGLTPGSYHQIYFDTWGGRAYLFAQDVPYAPLRDMPAESALLPMNADVFRAMGGQYIISRVAVENAAALGLRQCGVYTGAGTPYTLYVYSA